MVTRFIEKDKPTQVNSDKIGVQVSAPVSITDITADYKVNTVTAATTYTEGETQFGKMFVDMIGNIYYDTQGSEEIDGLIWSIFHRFGETISYYSAPEPDYGYHIYIKEESGLVQYGEVNHLLDLTGSGTQLTGGTVSISNNVYSFYAYGGQLFLQDSQNIVKGWVSGITQASTSTTFSKQDTSSIEGKTEWSANGVSVWTDSDKPAVGDTVYQTADDLTFNTTAVTEVTTETGEIACQVSYSIKGDVFTTVTPTLTDENNVICNIPRYVYLKFSQDVEITEE